jgi:nitroreductase
VPGGEPMDEIKPTKKPSRDYQALSSTPWDLFAALYARRSHRKYLPVPEDPSFVADLESFLDAACDARGASRDSIVAVTGQQAVEDVKRAAYKGMAGKINIWLGKAPLSAVLVADLPSEDVHAIRPVELPKTVMAIEDAVLWLTERGLGTCWLAGVSEREIMKVMGAPSGRSVPSIISIGKPALEPKPASYSGVSFQMMSRRRKPLEKIAASETASAPYCPPRLTACGFAAASGGAEEMVRAIASKSLPTTAGGLDLAIDACLEAARVAPSGNNAQAWLFVVVRSKDRLAELAAASGAAEPGSWKAAVVATGQGRLLGKILLDRPFWDIDVPIAMSHISLMAATAGYLPQVATDIDEEKVGRLVALPSGMRVAGVVALT